MSDRYMRYILGLVILVLLVINFFLSLISNIYISYASIALSGLVVVFLLVLLIYTIGLKTNLDIYKSISGEGYKEVFLGRWKVPNQLIILTLAYFRISQINYFTNDHLDIYTLQDDVYIPSLPIYPKIEILVDRALIYFGDRPKDIYTNSKTVLVLPKMTYMESITFRKTLKNIITNQQGIYVSNLHGSFADFVLDNYQARNRDTLFRNEIDKLQDFNVDQEILKVKPETLSNVKSNIMDNILFNPTYFNKELGGDKGMISNYIISITDRGVIDLGPRIKKDRDRFLDTVDYLASNIPKEFLGVYILNHIYTQYS